MRVDVSEIKTFKACKRQWQLSSRNRFHLTPRVAPPQLALGTIFHEALAQLYLGVSLDKVMEMVRKEMSNDSDGALLAMIPGYYNNVLPGDLDRFKVLDIEHHFEFIPTTSDGEPLFPFNYVIDETGEIVGEPALTICGSIDMICLDVEQNKIYGFEHKTCKNFRDESYLWMDEQPRVYTWALQKYVEEYNAKRYDTYLEDVLNGYNVVEPEPATLGGIYLNEVKKLLRNFQYHRTLCIYSDEDLDNFMKSFFSTCSQLEHMVNNNDFAAPQPNYFTCQMCTFRTICSTYMYNNLDKETVLEEFQEEFVEREEDHLDEKMERSLEE